MENYKLYKVLKDNGYPQELISGGFICPHMELLETGTHKCKEEIMYHPTLSELEEEIIKMCGNGSRTLCYEKKLWVATWLPKEDKDKNTKTIKVQGKTPHKAMANLWLALHNNKKNCYFIKK